MDVSHRHPVAAVGVAAMILATLALGTVEGAPDRREGSRVGSGAAAGGSPETLSQEALFACPERHPVFTRHAPPIMHIQEERAKARAVEQASGTGWSVAFAEPTRLGIFAFVDGDLDAAEPPLLAAGASHVWERDQGPEFGDGDDREALVSQGMQWALERPMTEVRRALAGLPDDGELAYWNEAGAIFVQWKRPLPAPVAALAESRLAGALVVVEETAYSPREITAASNRIFAAAGRGEIPAQLTSGGSCGDLSGVLIGVEPESLGARGPELQERLVRIAGVPVHVVPQEPARAL